MNKSLFVKVQGEKHVEYVNPRQVVAVMSMNVGSDLLLATGETLAIRVTPDEFVALADTESN